MAPMNIGAGNGALCTLALHPVTNLAFEIQ
jgi:hypothetical protein